MKTIEEDNYYNQIKELNISHYTGEVPYYIQAPLRQVERKILISISKGSRILDVGCGSGRFSIGAAQEGYDVTGIDITSEAINAASNKAKRIELNNINFLVGDMTNMPFKDNEFDYVFCPRFSINAVATFQRRQKTIQEMIRVVKPGGIVYIESFNRFYLGKGLFFLLKNIFLDIQKIFIMAFCWIFQKQYIGLLLGDITYRANKVNTASKGYAHLPTIFELKKLTSAYVPLKFYSIPQIVKESSVDIFKYLRYSIWILLTKKKS
jgi:ubiquinone/menaquinone biosynthesis C-methylase UbiE